MGARPRPAVPTEIGGLTPAVDWPSQLQFLIYVAGSLQAGRCGEISLGVIHDSTKFSTNDYTALFSEECVALINRGPDLRLITVPICPNGATAAQITAACPIA
ncbi:major capsid protein [Nonomuraea dietziae]|uniref:major capsid protein n=1 Tax=Nonomuraea dietziae TaxID=65515 RepID=UPI0034162F31